MVKQQSITKIGNITLSKGAYIALMKRKGVPINNKAQSKSQSCQNSPNVPRQQANFASCAKGVIQGRALNFSNEQIFPSTKKRVPTPKTIPIHKPIQKPKFQIKKNNTITNKLNQAKKADTKIMSKHQYNQMKATKKMQKSLINDKENTNPQLGNLRQSQINTKKVPQKPQQQQSLQQQRQGRTALRSLKNSQISQSISITSTKKKHTPSYYSPQKQQLKQWHKPGKDLITRHTFFLPPVFANNDHQNLLQQKNSMNNNSLRKSMQFPLQHSMVTRSHNSFQQFNYNNKSNNNTSSIRKFNTSTQSVGKRKIFQGYEVKFLTPKQQILQFNCFKEKDLGIQKEFTDLINNNMDNDQETDDEQIHMAVRNVFMSLCKSLRDEQIFALQRQEQAIMEQQQIQQQDQDNQQDQEQQQQEQQEQDVEQYDEFQEISMKSSVKSVYREDEILGNDDEDAQQSPKLQIFRRNRQFSKIEEEQEQDDQQQLSFSEKVQVQWEQNRRKRRTNNRYNNYVDEDDDDDNNENYSNSIHSQYQHQQQQLQQDEDDNVSCVSRYSAVSGVSTRRMQQQYLQQQRQQQQDQQQLYSNIPQQQFELAQEFEF